MVSRQDHPWCARREACKLFWTRLATVSAGAIGFCLLMPGVGAASPIDYTETATISGSLNGQSFSNDLFILNDIGDTANASKVGLHIWTNAVVLGFSIASVGSGIFTDSTQVASNNVAPDAGFGDITKPARILFTINNVFSSSYNLMTSIGPITGTALFSSGFPITAGELIINSVAGAPLPDATFSAVGFQSATPLPAALPLFATGLGALGLLGWRRKRKHAQVC